MCSASKAYIDSIMFTSTKIALCEFDSYTTE